MTRQFLCLLALAGLAGALALPARADNACIDRCFSNFSPSQMGGSEELRRECLAQCKAPSVSYGAIAYGGKSTANGYAYDKSSAAEAARSALGYCRGHGNDCAVVINFSNACAAVAAVESKSRFVTAQGRSRALAQNNALHTCQSQIGGACKIEVWTCSGS